MDNASPVHTPRFAPTSSIPLGVKLRALISSRKLLTFPTGREREPGSALRRISNPKILEPDRIDRISNPKMLSPDRINRFTTQAPASAPGMRLWSAPAEWSRWNVSLRLAVAPAGPGGAGRRSAAGHAVNAGTNTSGAGGLYPSEAWGLIVFWRIASTMFWPCETRTSTCRNFATISSGLYRFLAITVIAAGRSYNDCDRQNVALSIAEQVSGPFRPKAPTLPSKFRRRDATPGFPPKPCEMRDQAQSTWFDTYPGREPSYYSILSLSSARLNLSAQITPTA
jgi:hypothetical protein